jgi:hypothetical protein
VLSTHLSVMFIMHCSIDGGEELQLTHDLNQLCRKRGENTRSASRNAYKYSVSPAKSLDLNSMAFNTSVKRKMFTGSVGKEQGRLTDVAIFRFQSMDRRKPPRENSRNAPQICRNAPRHTNYHSQCHFGYSHITTPIFAQI